MLIADFPHKRLLTSPEHIGERLLDVREGVALVETGYDARPLLDAISKGAELIRGPRFTNRGMYVTFRDGNAHADQAAGINAVHSEPDFYGLVTLGFEQSIGSRSLDEMGIVGRELLKGVLAEIDPSKSVDDIGNTIHINVANRHRGGNIGHVDYAAVLTAWFGATHPGLRIGTKNNCIFVPDAPAGYALLWRGVDFMGEDEATRHTVSYRGKQARVSAIGF